MSASIARPSKYIKGNTGPYTKHVPPFTWFWLLVVKSWMNEVLQVAKMVLSLKQFAFIVKLLSRALTTTTTKVLFFHKQKRILVPSSTSIAFVKNVLVITNESWSKLLWFLHVFTWWPKNQNKRWKITGFPFRIGLKKYWIYILV